MPSSPGANTGPQVSEAVFAGALVDAVHTLRKPVTAALLAQHLVGPFQCPPAVLEPVLDGLVAEGRLILLPARSTQQKPAYSTREIRELARLTVLDILSDPEASLSLAKLKSHPGFKQVAGYLSEDVLPRILAQLVSERRIFVHPKCTATGKIQTKLAEVSYGSSPARAELYLTSTLKGLQKQLKVLAVALQPFGVDADSVRHAFLAAIRDEYGTELEVASATGTSRSEVRVSTEDPSGLGLQIYRRMTDLNPAVRTGAMVRLDRLRTLCWDLAETKSQFDEAIRWLANTHHVVLHHHNGQRELSSEETASLVPDNRAGFYDAVSWRI